MMNPPIESFQPPPSHHSASERRNLPSSLRAVPSCDNDLSNVADAADASVTNRPSFPEDSLPSWILPSIFSNSAHGRKNKATSASSCLADIPLEELKKFLEPILDGLRCLDAEGLLHLERTRFGGATLRDG
jgi:hypothetical protein